MSRLSQMIRISCHCNLTQLYVKCGEWNRGDVENEDEKERLACCQNQCPKTMKCGHRYLTSDIAYIIMITQPDICHHASTQFTKQVQTFQVLQDLSSGRVQRSLDLQEAVKGVLPMQEEEGGAALLSVFVWKQKARLRRRLQESQGEGQSILFTFLY